MDDDRTTNPQDLEVVASTVPLLASLTVVDRATSATCARWVVPDTPQELDAPALARLLGSAVAALGAGAHGSAALTVATDAETVVIVALWEDRIAVFGFREAVSYDWASFYVRRALGMLRRH